MNTGLLLDSVPLWGLFVMTVIVVLLSVEGGFRAGRYHRRCTKSEQEPPVGSAVGATLALLAFMLAFTFSMTSSRFDSRKQFVLEEANAIGTCYLRAGLLPDPHRTETRRLLR